jgi:hypothetical protein
MFSAVQRRLTYANVVATLALVFAMSGGALAAKHYLVNSTKQINPKVLRKLKGSRGQNGRNGVNGPAGPAGAAGREGPAGPQGPGARELTAILPASATPTFTSMGAAFGINLEAECEEKLSHAVLLKMNYTSTIPPEALQTDFRSIGGGPTTTENQHFAIAATSSPAVWEELEATELTSSERFDANYTSPKVLATESYYAHAGPGGSCEVLIGMTPAS